MWDIKTEIILLKNYININQIILCTQCPENMNIIEYDFLSLVLTTLDFYDTIVVHQHEFKERNPDDHTIIK